MEEDLTLLRVLLRAGEGERVSRDGTAFFGGEDRASLQGLDPHRRIRKSGRAERRREAPLGQSLSVARI